MPPLSRILRPFDVAAIKRNPEGIGPSGSMRESPGTINYTQVQSRDPICKAYGVQPLQIWGGPGWIESEAYDITATLTPPDPQYAQGRLMRQTLPKLEPRKAPVETLVVDHVEKPTEN